MKGKNLIGPKVRRARYKKGWSQQQLAVKLQLAGFDISRSGVGKIEAQLRKVSDLDFLYILRVLEMSLEELLDS
ncbi:MAG: helix-turn-helix domain-containing protein [Verrucomicrobiales bacterium]